MEQNRISHVQIKNYLKLSNDDYETLVSILGRDFSLKDLENFTNIDIDDLTNDILEERPNTKLLEIIKRKINTNVSNIQLGDIIKLTYTDEEKEQIILVTYINKSYLEGVDILTKEFITLRLKLSERVSEMYSIEDTSYKKIQILVRSNTPSFARQYNLYPGTPLRITMKPKNFTQEFTIEGNITELQYDTIEIQYTSIEPETIHIPNPIYINFNYVGLPKELGISSFEILSYNPSVFQPQYTERQEQLKTVQEQLKDIQIDMTDIQGGPDIHITQRVELPEDEQRYALNTQIDDLVNDLMSSQYANKIDVERIIKKYTLLRNDFSVFDQHNNIKEPRIIHSTYKPLVNNYKYFKQPLFWIQPVVFSPQTFYFKGDEETAPKGDDYMFENQNELFKQYKTDLKEYLSYRPTDDNQTTYSFYQSIIHKIFSNRFPNYKNLSITDFKPSTDTIFTLDTLKLKQPFHSIVNNLPILMSSTSKFTDYFALQRVLEPPIYSLYYMIEDTTLKKRDTVLYKKEIYNGDIPHITSFIFINPLYEYSRCFLPLTNILQKTELDKIALPSMNKFLSKYTSLHQTETFNEFNSFYTYYCIPKSNETYEQFLERICPTTKEILSSIPEHTLNTITTLTKFIYQLEPFYIYHDDITFKSYALISSTIQNTIEMILNKFKEQNIQLKYISKLKTLQTRFEPIIRQLLEHSTEQLYNIEHVHTDETALKNIMIKDYGQTLFTELSLKTPELILPEDVYEQMKTIIEQINTYQSDTEECKEKQIYSFVKVYYSKEELEKDQNTFIYVDPHLDTTDYSIINPYIQKQNDMTKDDFILFLMKELSIQEDEAITLIQGRKLVKDGDIAMLIEAKGIDTTIMKSVYRRENNMWIHDKELEVSNPSLFERVQCEMNTPYCIYNTNQNECISIEERRKLNAQRMLERNVIEFKHRIETSSKEYIDMIERQYEHHKSMLNLLQSIQKFNDTYYSKQQYEYGQYNKDKDEYNIESQSPYTKTRDLILGDSDFTRKIKNLKLFIEKYTRPANEMLNEDTHWFYCNETSSKLLPTFYMSIIQGYEHGEYELTIARLCKERGALSNDQDRWVDKYSGFTIQNIDFSTEEGYDESGFRIIQRTVIDADMNEELQQLLEEEKNKRSTPFKTEREGQISHITHYISRMMGIPSSIMNQESLIWIVRHTNTQMKTQTSKEEYNEKRELMKQRGKRLPPEYDVYIHRIMIFYTSLYLFIFIHTHIPNIYGLRSIYGTEPNMKSIEQGLVYLSKLLYMIRRQATTSIPIWSSLMGLNEQSLLKYISSLMNNVILKQNEIKERLRVKQRYETELITKHPIQTNETTSQYEVRLKLIEYNQSVETIPEYLKIQKWTTFNPPLNKTIETQKSLINNKTLISNLVQSLNITQDQLRLLSFRLWNTLRQYTQKDIDLILKTKSGIPYLENACCSTPNIQSIIEHYNEISNDLKFDLIKKISYIQNVMIEGTQYPITLIPTLQPLNELLHKSYDNYSPEFVASIYLNYSYSITHEYIQRLPEEIRSLLLQIRAISMNPTHTHEERVQTIFTTIERERFDKSLLYNLLYSLSKITVSPIYTYTLFPSFETFLPIEEFTPERLVNLLKDQKNTNQTTDLLRRFQNVYQHKIVQFLKQYQNKFVRLRKKQYSFKQVIHFLEESWNHMIPVLHEYYSITDSTSIQMIQLCRQWLYYISMLIPNMNLNIDTLNLDYSYADYWSKKYKLSGQHISHLVTIMGEFYSLIINEQGWTQEHDTVQIEGQNIKVQSIYFNEIIKKCYNVIEMVTRIQPNIKPVSYTKDEYHEYEDTLEGVYNETTELKLKENKSDLFFNGYTTLVLYQYAITYCLYQYIYSLQKVSQTIQLQSQTETVSLGQDEINDTNDLVLAKKNTYEEYTTDLLCRILHFMKIMKEKGTMNQTKIKENILRIREKEKEGITEMLGNLTDEEREAENLRKEFKLGEKWSKGLGKTFREYDADVYEMEYNELKQRRIKDLEKQDITRDVTDMNATIYAEMDREELLRGIQIEEEEYSMNYMHNDDDYPEELDGDEQFY